MADAHDCQFAQLAAIDNPAHLMMVPRIEQVHIHSQEDAFCSSFSSQPHQFALALHGVGDRFLSDDMLAGRHRPAYLAVAHIGQRTETHDIDGGSFKGHGLAVVDAGFRCHTCGQLAAVGTGVENMCYTIMWTLLKSAQIAAPHATESYYRDIELHTWFLR